MMHVGISELEGHLSDYLDAVRAGQTVVVMDQGMPVARLEGISPGSPPESVRHLVESGRLLWKGAPRGRLPAPIAMLPGQATSIDFLRDQRR